MTLFAELKRRNVFRVGFAYVVVSWLALQVCDVVLNNIEAPDWVFQVIMLLLAVGFPMALVFAWAFEMTPEGLKREHEVDRSQTITHETGQKLNRVTIAVLIIAVGYFSVDKFILSADRESAAIESAVEEAASSALDERLAKQATAAELQPSIAVLPFVDMSPDKDQDYFADGLSEELLNLLAKIPNLQVAARTSSFSFKGENLEITEIAKRLKVAHVLEGSVRTSGRRVRVTAQLIHAEDGFHLWSETYDRTLDDIFAIQDEIASEVVTQLKLALLGAAPKVKETNPLAYSLYLQGHHLTLQESAEGFQRAAELLQQAVSIDPGYVAAWAELSAVYSGQASAGLVPIDQGYAMARQAANKALAIDPAYVRAYSLLARISLGYDNDLAAAARYLEQGFELEPTNHSIITQAARVAQALGKIDTAIEMGKFLVARDPVGSRGLNVLGISYMYSGQWDNAISAFRNVLTLSPTYFGAHYRIGTALLAKGEPAAALIEMQQEPDEEYRVKGTAVAMHDLGRQEEFEKLFAELRDRWGEQWPSEVAHVYAWIGEADAAFEWLDKAVEQNEDGLSEQFDNEYFISLHDDPRWADFRERTGSSQAQLDKIKFKVKLPD